MKKLISGILLSLLLSTTLCAKQHSSNVPPDEQWYCQITFANNMGPFNVILYLTYEDSTSFTAHSSPNADKRIFGNMKATMGRWMKKSPKKGIFMSITDGTIFKSQGSDSLMGIIHIPMIGSMDLKAVKTNDTIIGSLRDETQVLGSLNGTRSPKGFRQDYQKINERIIDTLEANIYNPDLLQTKQWKRFNKKLDKVSKRALDDLEYFFGFGLHSQKLPFSHLNLFLFAEPPDMAAESGEKYLFLKELTPETAYLNVTSFGGSAGEMDSIFEIILKNNYRDIIIDLRSNGGGGIESAIPFGAYLCDEPLDAGYFVTNKWYQHYQAGDSPDFGNIQVTTATTTAAFIQELKHSPGKQLIITPAENTYKGNVIVLTSGKTASTCEPIVYALKKHQLATIVGQTTAGAMLSAAFFQVYGKYYLFLPIADYYTSDGKRLDQVGVEPDIPVEAESALDVAKQLLAVPD
ncbi:MAG: S41 family peptidase [Candidatus Cloacimonetes bacterium]|nr:S41 family peptidase [Candidatus Cloacimonadota bacterium]